MGLERLFWIGEVTTTTRRNFERIYNLPERVLPAKVLNTPTPPVEESQRHLLGVAAGALGVAAEADLRDYFRLTAADARPRIAELTEGGELIPVKVEGWKTPAYLHRRGHPRRPGLKDTGNTPLRRLIDTRRIKIYHHTHETNESCAASADSGCGKDGVRARYVFRSSEPCPPGVCESQEVRTA